MTQLLHKYISLIKAVIKGEEAKFFKILRHKSVEDPKDRAFWAELSSTGIERRKSIERNWLM